ncbi:hypothetical protein KC345_g5947 [Hortaea werneckii]|nr:hypothetical protein KC345_g5947 [Hortaea werneckii]
MRLALAAAGIVAFTNRVGAEADSRREGTDVIDSSKSTQVLHHHQEGAPPWWQRAWAASSQLVKRIPKPQDGQEAPIVPGTRDATEEQCSGVHVVTSTITPVTTATVTTTKETTTTQFIYPSPGTTTDENDEKTVIITPSDYGVDIPPLTTTVTRYPSEYPWDHSWTAGSWNSKWKGNTATYTVTISEIEMPISADVETVTETVTISNVEIPWTTTKPTSQEVVTSTFTATTDGSIAGILETTTITEGNGPQTTVAMQPGETGQSVDRPSYVYTTVTYTTKLSPPFQNPNDTSAITATASTGLPTTNDTQPPNFSLTTVTSTFQVPAPTAIETQYTTTLVSGDTTQTVVVTERPSNSPASMPIETQYTTTLVSGNATQSIVVTERPSNSQSSLLASPPASEHNLTSTFTNTANGRPNSGSSSQVSLTFRTTDCLEYSPDIDCFFRDAVRRIIDSSVRYQFDNLVRRAAHFDVWIDIIYLPWRTANNTVGPGIQRHILCTFKQPVGVDAERPHDGIFDNAVIHETWSHICCGFEWTECYVAYVSERAAVRHSVFDEPDFIGSAAVNDYERLYDLKRFLGPSAFEIVRLIKRSLKPGSPISIKLFSTSGVVYIAANVLDRSGIAAFLKLLGFGSDTIFSLAALSKLDPGIPEAFEFAKYVNYSGFEFNEPSALCDSQFNYCGAPAFIWLGIFYDDTLELPEILRPSTFEIV